MVLVYIDVCKKCSGCDIVCIVPVFLLWKPCLVCSAALLTVSEEVRSRCSLKHRKSLLLTDVSMENVPMDTYPIHHTDTSYRLVVSLVDKLPTLRGLFPLGSELCCAENWAPWTALSPWAVVAPEQFAPYSGIRSHREIWMCNSCRFNFQSLTALEAVKPFAKIFLQDLI